MKNLAMYKVLALAAALSGCGSVVVGGQGPGDDGGGGDASWSSDGPAPTDRPPANDAPPVIDVPPQVDVPGACTTSADCARGMACLGGEGCAVPWTCQPAVARPCTADLAPFCGCDGTTFYGSSSCPERPFSRRGACADAGTPRVCNSTRDCPANSLCTGPEGCGTRWTCQPAPPCTRDLGDYCACDGTSFQSSSTCPGRPYAHRGRCDIVPPPVDAGPGTCVVGGVTCRVGVPCRIDECTTCTCDGDTVACAVTPGCAMDGGVDAGGPPPLCPAQDARGVGACDRFLGYAWDGSRCVGVSGCTCAGADCMSLPFDPIACDNNHRACPRPL